MSRSQRRLERIKSEISLAQVLADYGYRVSPNGEDREQQYCCDLHGDGQDTRPSARLYGWSNTTYCFACDKIRDAVEIVRAKEGLEYKDAVVFLERKYGLPVLPWEDDDFDPQKPKTVVEEMTGLLANPGISFEAAEKAFEADLDGSTKDRTLSLDATVSFWEALDTISYKVKEGELSEALGLQALGKINKKYQEAVWAACKL
jgi:hypothetical protein